MNALRSLGKQLPPKPSDGIQELASDARVHAHPVGDFLDVGAGQFAQHGDGVDVGNFQREKRIGGVLDQLRRIDVRHDDGRVIGRVNLLHGGHRPPGGDAHHHPVRLHEILHGKTLAQKLRVADDVEIQPWPSNSA